MRYPPRNCRRSLNTVLSACPVTFCCSLRMAPDDNLRQWEINREYRERAVEAGWQKQDFAVLHKIRWIFTTPLSPHQGGMYESLIKQTKRALKATVGPQTLSWNEMSGVFAEVKCLIKQQPPGVPQMTLANDHQPLLPNHIILGRATGVVPQGPYKETRNLWTCYEFVQMLLNHFWKWFVREHLQTLMRRAKWHLRTRQLKVRDVVLLVDYNSPRGKWDLAQITNWSCSLVKME